MPIFNTSLTGMEKRNVLLVYYEMPGQGVFGEILGSRYEAAGKDLEEVQSLLIAHIAKIYKKETWYPRISLDPAEVSTFQVSVRPTYQMEENELYPLSTDLSIPIHVVHGRSENGFFECYIPALRQHFHYTSPDQLPNLVQAMSLNALYDYYPVDLYDLASMPKPSLEVIPMKLKGKKRAKPLVRRPGKNAFPSLQRLAEQMPPVKTGLRRMSALPDIAWEMGETTAHVMRLLKQQVNVLVCGYPGVGKSAVLRQVIAEVARAGKRDPRPQTFWRLFAQRITASARYLGEWQENVDMLVDDLQAANGVLWVEDLTQLATDGGSGPEDSIAAYMRSFLVQGKIQIMGEITPPQLDSLRRLLPGFAELFQVVEIPEMPEKKVTAVMDHFAAYAQRQHGIKFETESLNRAYRLLNRFYPYERFPGKAIKFLSRCMHEAMVSEVKNVDKSGVIETFIQMTGMPELFLRDDLRLDQEDMRRYFAGQIIGQPAAVDALCDIVKIFKAGLNNPHKPIATFMFSGPTGVGKTASAKALASFFFGKGQERSPLIRIDMSEFQSPGDIYRLVGRGNEVGMLVREVREKPFSVLLLDEIEKADPSVFDALLTLLDEGILTDAAGRATNFRNTIIILTTNLGASNRQAIGLRPADDQPQRYLSAIEGFFRPEFVNRIDQVVLFNALRQAEIEQIARKELSGLREREGIRMRGLELSFTDRLVEFLSEKGFDEKFGARPLQRAIETQVVQPLARWLLANPQTANRALMLDYADGLRVL